MKARGNQAVLPVNAANIIEEGDPAFKMAEILSELDYVETDVVPGTVFYSWVCGFGGKVVINGPTEVKEQYKVLVLKAAEGL